MGIRDKFKTDKKKIQQQKDAYSKSKDYKLGEFTSFFELSDGMQQFMWKASKEGQSYSVDIIPFLVAENFPDKMFRGSPPNEGDPWFTVDLHVHNNIGPNNEKVVCPKHSFKNGIAAGTRPGCPICEDLAKKQEEVADDPEKRKAIWREMKPMRRNLYNIIVRDDGEEEDKGVQLFDVAYFYFQQNIEEVLDEDDEGVTTYWDIEEGKQIRFKVTDQGENQPPKFGGFKLKDRKYEIDEEDLEDSVSPQKWLKLYTYEELYQMHHQNGNGTKKNDDEDTTQLETRKSRRDKNRTTDPPVDDDLNDLPSNAEDDQSLNECSFGHVFGEDAGSHDECQSDCSMEKYKRCLKAKVDSDNKEENPPEKETRRTRRGRK